MIKTFLFQLLFVSFSVLFFSFEPIHKITFLQSSSNKPGNNSVTTSNPDCNDEVTSISSTLYSELQLDQEGLSSEALTLAIKGYQKLINEGMVHNTKYLTIVDLSQSSRNRRFYLLDLEKMKLVMHTFVAHGKNSGLDQAQQFSNNPNSEASSLGFYVTKTTYSGKHGLSLKLSGVEDGFNNNAEARGIVVHGASYVNAARANSSYMGRSQGCPALPQNEFTKVIRLIKDGSVLFVYNPNTNYLQNSTLLNS